MSFRARLLVVEDDLLQAALASSVLEAQGYFVDVATNGLDAIRKMLVGWFDVILMDYHIPDLDGLAVARIIADLTRAEGRPRLIAVSASTGLIHDRESGAPSVFDAITAKPWNPVALSRVIEACLHAAPPSPRLADEPASSRPASPPLPPDPALARVLVVDDDAPLRSIVCLCLKADGFLADEAADGLDALRKVVAHPYDVVVLDYRLPEIDGLATSRLIHELVDSSARPRLVALTSTPTDLSARESGSLTAFDEIIPKNRGLKALVTCVRRCADYRLLRSTLEPAPIVRFDAILKLAAEP